MAFDYTTPQNILSTVKHNLGLEDDTAQDSLINALIQGVIAAFNTQCSTSFVEHKVFEHQFFIKCGELLRTFVLPYLPVVTITGVVSDDTTITYEEGDYKLLKASGILIFQYDVTPEQIITVSGTYGYSLIPENVGLAISTQVLFLFDKRRGMAKRGMSVPGGDVSLEEKVQVLSFCKEILHPYQAKG